MSEGVDLVWRSNSHHKKTWAPESSLSSTLCMEKFLFDN